MRGRAGQRWRMRRRKSPRRLAQTYSNAGLSPSGRWRSGPKPRNRPPRKSPFAAILSIVRDPLSVVGCKEQGTKYNGQRTTETGEPPMFADRSPFVLALPSDLHLLTLARTFVEAVCRQICCDDCF